MRQTAAQARPAQLPAWPVLWMFAGFPAWWILGAAQMVWFIFAVPMVAYLVRERGRVLVPRGFGLYALFCAWMLASVIQIDTGGRLVGFALRAGIYLGAGVIFLYVYNAKSSLPLARMSGILSVYWVIVVLFGLLAVARPEAEFHTLFSYVVPRGLLQNDLVSQMFIPHLSQGNPDGYYHFAPRPSAPFDYTNTWGSNYSLLLPFVFISLATMRRWTARYWGLLVMVPISLVPAFETQNRGMLLGIGVALVYLALRLALRGHVKALLGIIGLVVVAALLITVLPILSEVEARVSTGASNDTRLAIYEETFQRTLQSPLFGYGAPRPSLNLLAGAPAVGTQGQVWLVMFSFGFVGLALFMGWLVYLCARTLQARTVPHLWLHIVIVIGTFESVYYGMVGSQLVVIMIAAALALSRPETPPQTHRPTRTMLTLASTTPSTRPAHDVLVE